MNAQNHVMKDLNKGKCYTCANAKFTSSNDGTSFFLSCTHPEHLAKVCITKEDYTFATNYIASALRKYNDSKPGDQHDNEKIDCRVTKGNYTAKFYELKEIYDKMMMNKKVGEKNMSEKNEVVSIFVAIISTILILVISILILDGGILNTITNSFFNMMCLTDVCYSVVIIFIVIKKFGDVKWLQCLLRCFVIILLSVICFKIMMILGSKINNVLELPTSTIATLTILVINTIKLLLII